MARIALFSSDGITVENVIVGNASDWPGSDDVTDADPSPGPGWQRINGVYQPPAPPTPEAPPTSWFITEKEFMGRWTMTELAAFYALKATDPMVAAADALVTRLGGVQNDSQRTQMLMGYLVQKGVITAERVPVLLARPVA